MMKKNRLKVIALAVFLFGVVIYGRLFFLQVVMGKYYSELADENRLREEVVPAERGSILDRDNRVLAEQIEFGGKRVRYYPAGEMVSHLLGFVKEMKGVLGVESAANSVLSGRDGVELWELDALGNKVRRLARRDPSNGDDVRLNIDLDLQRKSYFALLAKLEETGKGGAVIVSKVDGEVLALVSLPAFDPNLFISGGKRGEAGGIYVSAGKVVADTERKPMFDRAISGVYPPGSVYKLVPAIAGLEEGVIDTQTMIEDTGEIKIGKQRFGNWYFDKYGRKEGKINIVRAIARSNDIFFYKLGEKIGVDKLVEYSSKFGIGEVTGIDLSGESKGLLPTPLWRERKMGERWFLGNTYHLSIGQGDLLMSPLQVNRMTVSVVSGKKCVPRVVSVGERECVDLDVSDSNREIVIEGMREACSSGGTAFPFFDLVSEEVWCKTGTAQHGGEDAKPHAWITVVLPEGGMDNWLVITVMLEDAGEGSEMAGPVAREMVDYLIKTRDVRSY